MMRSQGMGGGGAQNFFLDMNSVIFIFPLINNNTQVSNTYYKNFLYLSFNYCQIINTTTPCFRLRLLH